jgi:hypothetical protein
MNRSAKVGLRDAVELVGYNAVGAEVFRHTLSRYDYYERIHPVIDENSFRLVHGISRLVGKIYDDAGSVEQEFENTYSESGSLSLSGARFSDGTINGDWNALRGADA